MKNADTQAVVLIAGSSSGIGQSCVSAFRNAGWKVIGIARSQAEIEEHNFAGIALDLTDESASARRIAEVVARWDTLDTVIHSVGDIYEAKDLKEITWSRWSHSYDLCVGTAVTLVRHTFDHIARNAGSYIFISSIGAQKPYYGIADYCAAKAALCSVSRSVAAELASYGGRSNTISPAVVDTPLFRKGPYTEEEAAQWHQLGRIGRPEEIALMALHLASSSSAWITGQDFVLDGGMTL